MLTSQLYYYKWGEVHISVSDTHYDNNRRRSRVEPTITLEMWCGTGTCYLQSDQKLMFTFVFYCRCLGVWRNADIHCWVNVDDVICKVRLVFRNCVEIMVGIFESQKCMQCKIFVVCCNEYT